MGYFKRRGSLGDRKELIDKVVQELVKLSYGQLVDERRWTESLLKNFDLLRELGLIPFVRSKDELGVIVRAYKVAVQKKERDILKRVLEAEKGTK